jgi:MerR family transcriptional regulator, thiopeptide resistance regulator
VVKAAQTRLYRAHEFAELAGVTVRTLHHYDRLGLLKPSHRSEAGYRLYSDRDLVRLEQIVVLKFVGLPLKEIRDLLKREKSALTEVLRRQTTVLAEKRKQLEDAMRTIEAARRAMSVSEEPDWKLFTQITRGIAMQNQTDWTGKYYSEEAKAKVGARKDLWSPEMQERVSREWDELVRDIEAALGDDPASAKAQALAARWKNLVEGFTGGDPEIQKGLNKMYADMPNWPAEAKRHNPIKPEVQEFMMKATSAKDR